ncbi:MAG: hypothetical protein ABR956_17435, partial [Terracidiphilus sp.]
MQTIAASISPLNSSAPTRNQPQRQPRSSRRNRVLLCTLRACLLLAACLLSTPTYAQSGAAELAPEAGSAGVLSVVRWNGSLPEAAGRPVEIRFSLYQDQAGG